SFRLRLDNLANMPLCTVCKEAYPGIKVKLTATGPICTRCYSERNGHHFSSWNNMDPGVQPHVLGVLTQVEEMLIARVNPIMQVSHARGGQYKYRGHTITFPQDITLIAAYLPRRVRDLDILIVRRHGSHSKHYDYLVKRSHVLDALRYKICNDRYYKDVQLCNIAISELPEEEMDISQSLQFVESNIDDNQNVEHFVEDPTTSNFEELQQQPSSFAIRMGNTRREMEE
ncbi:hypothetical protein KI387_041308, partial [Taxus chinensis]